MRKVRKNEKGFTLVELLASIIILSIIIIGIFQMFVFTSKTATSNQTKLVTTHLAKATIERIKVDAESFFPLDIVNVNEEKEINSANCSSLSNVDCDLYEIKVNDLTYQVEIYVSQNEEEVDLNLINVVVTVTEDEKNLSSKVEGYVVDE